MHALRSCSIKLGMEHAGRAKHFDASRGRTSLFHTKGRIPVGGCAQPAMCCHAPGEHPCTLAESTRRQRGQLASNLPKTQNGRRRGSRSHWGDRGIAVAISRELAAISNADLRRTSALQQREKNSVPIEESNLQNSGL